jgi:hypothetical protein
MAGNWMIPPRYLAMDADGNRAFAAQGKALPYRR